MVRLRKEVPHNAQPSSEQEPSQVNHRMYMYRYRLVVMVAASCAYLLYNYQAITMFSVSKSSVNRQQLAIPSFDSNAAKPFEKYYQMKVMQDFMRTNFIPQQGYPIPKHKWEAVSNTTCVTPSRTDDRNDMTYKQHQMPHGIVIGVQKGGSTATLTFLGRHPHLQIPRRELQFMSFEMDTNMPSDAQGIDQQYWQQEYYNWTLKYLRDSGKKKIEHPYVVEKTPNYVLLSDRVPQRVLCLCPWAKLILVLRNPVDRAYSQYNMQLGDKRRERQAMGPMPSFEEWMREDYEVLKALGVIQDGGKGYQGTAEENEGWSAYTKLATIGHVGGLGRGLYSLQISQWIHAYQQAGQPLDMLVMSSEHVKAEPQEAFGQMCDHLGVPRVELQEEKITRGTNTRNYTIPAMSNATRQWLEEIYRPYSEQLFGLLGQKTDWQHIWES